MPLYEYKCEKCGTVFDVLQKFSDEPLKVHKDCGGKVDRLISPSAFKFKGSGWYITDYARKSNGTSIPDHSNGNESKSEKPSETKSSESTKSSASPSCPSKP